ncbi:Serine/threonine-protein kinase H1 [Desmophyllum pertusum]|uniref:Serine/threonine-protein kinase H1 n=1 Tax=Desmophyllum pertusum TaxID=174260 RepID=A0A9X0CKD6_9CNID|nr:Serine/threonine-protein kinase H1 [Desmophyllum pertusum]
MGCNNSKKLDDEDCVKTSKLPDEEIASREVCTKLTVNNESRKNSEKKPKKGRVLEGKLSFDPVVTDNYEIKAIVGRGSFSRVVRVEHKKTKQPYAIKMIKVQGSKDVFESEVAVLRKVKHDYIVQLYEVFECPERVYMVMELATGGELFDRIVSKGSFTEHDATRVMSMVLDGVRYLHSLGITHRDLKPENLLYYHPGNDSKIMITDFGLSNTRQNSDSETMDTTCGTPEYIAPEILMSQSYTNSVDMWAIGVITHILLSGEMPFLDENRTRMYKAILKAKYSYNGEAWKDVSDLAKQFIDKLLVLDPDKRMTADQALRDPWIASSSVSTQSLKNLHRTFSQNWLKSTSRLNSARSNTSQNSSKSAKSGRSVLSLPRRSNHITFPQDTSVISGLTSAQAQEIKHGGSKLSGLRESNVKLTKQLTEKLHSVINEDDRELLTSTATISECAEHPILRLSTAECESNRQHNNSHIIGTNTKITVDSVALQRATSQEVVEEKSRAIPIPAVKDRLQLSHLVMRDNFLEQHHIQEAQQDWSQDSFLRSSFTGESPSILRSLSPSPRKNKVYCTYDSS